MQHKKYRKKYKSSLVLGPTLWGHHTILHSFLIANKTYLGINIVKGELV